MIEHEIIDFIVEQLMRHGNVTLPMPSCGVVVSANWLFGQKLEVVDYHFEQDIPGGISDAMMEKIKEFAALRVSRL